MSTEITEAFVQQYSSNLIHLSQQKKSRLINTLDANLKINVKGKQVAFDRIGTRSMTQLTSRHADTVQADTPHSRRWASMAPYTDSDLIDDPDKVRTLIDPTNAYAIAQANAIGRTQDDIIIAAALGTAVTGETATGTQALPAAQKVGIQTGGGGSDAYLNLDKVLEAKRLLDAAEVDDENRWLIYNALQLSKILALEKFTSIDYNTQRALVEGNMPSFLGFTWIRSERLTTDSSSNTQVLAYQSNGLALAIGELGKTRITEESTKNYATQVWTYLDMGAVRVEDVRVVEIACKPS